MKYWCFDLFLTLVDVPQDMPHERELLGVSPEDWRRGYECAEITSGHDRGLLTDPIEITRELIASFGMRLSEAGEREFLRRRVERFRWGLTHVRPEILETLRSLRSRGCKLCLVSNADAVGILHWPDSPLAPLFDHTIFSCQVGMLKPEPGIYLLAAEHMCDGRAIFVQAIPSRCLANSTKFALANNIKKQADVVIRPCSCPESIRIAFTCLLAAVKGAVGMVVINLTDFFIIYPIAAIITVIRQGKGALAMLFVLIKAPGINLPIGPSESAFTGTFVHLPVAFIFSAIIPSHDTITMHFAI